MKSSKTSRSSSRALLVITIGASGLVGGCRKPSQPPPRPTASASVTASASLGLTPELDQLVALSKSQLSPAEKHTRLSTVLEKFPREHSKEREELIVKAIARGAYDPPEWRTITANYKGRRAEIQVSSDALTILGVRIDVTAEGAKRIADSLGTILPTPRILQLIWEQAEVRLAPCNSNPDAKMASTARMIEFTEQRPMTHILGCHIEQSDTPFVDYPVGTVYQPQEHALALSRIHLLALFAGLEKMGSKPEQLAQRDFTIVPRAPRQSKQ